MGGAACSGASSGFDDPVTMPGAPLPPTGSGTITEGASARWGT
jgi:hypothetical protein